MIIRRMLRARNWTSEDGWQGGLIIMVAEIFRDTLLNIRDKIEYKFDLHVLCSYSFI